MIEAPIFAIFIGSVFYSVIFGFVYYFYKNLKNDERAERSSWQKSREILAKAPDTKADDFDKL